MTAFCPVITAFGLMSELRVFICSSGKNQERDVSKFLQKCWTFI